MHGPMNVKFMADQVIWATEGRGKTGVEKTT